MAGDIGTGPEDLLAIEIDLQPPVGPELESGAAVAGTPDIRHGDACLPRFHTVDFGEVDHAPNPKPVIEIVWSVPGN